MKVEDYLVQGMGINIGTMDPNLLTWPVVETEAYTTRTYVKFMSEKGIYDDQLGDLFAEACRQRGTHFDRERARSGFVDRTFFPGLISLAVDDESDRPSLGPHDGSKLFALTYGMAAFSGQTFKMLDLHTAVTSKELDASLRLLARLGMSAFWKYFEETDPEHKKSYGNVARNTHQALHGLEGW